MKYTHNQSATDLFIITIYFEIKAKMVIFQKLQTVKGNLLDQNG